MDAWQHLLFHLYVDGSKWFKHLDQTDWRRELVPRHSYVQSLNVKLMMDGPQVENHLRSVSNASDPGPRKGFILRPCPHGEESLTILVPFIAQHDPVPRLSLQIGVVEKPAADMTFFGYRFESPELEEEHHFHHVQPVQAFGQGPALETAVKWYPNRYPSFPLAASGPTELVATVFVSIRDWTRLTHLSTSESTIPRASKQQFANFLKRIRPS